MKGLVCFGQERVPGKWHGTGSSSYPVDGRSASCIASVDKWSYFILCSFTLYIMLEVTHAPSHVS